MGSFLSAVCHFKCNATPSFDDIQQIYAAAKLQIKEEDKIISIPILVESEVYNADKITAARVSMRGGSGAAITSLFQLILTFMS